MLVDLLVITTLYSILCMYILPLTSTNSCPSLGANVRQESILPVQILYVVFVSAAQVSCGSNIVAWVLSAS